MRRYSLTARRIILTAAATFGASLAVATTGAQAVVVDMNPSVVGTGTTTVSYPNDQSYYYGVALTPQQTGQSSWEPGTQTTMLSTAGIPVVTTSGSCTDPALSTGLTLPASGLCSHQWSSADSVVHKNETFALVWDPRPYSDYTAPYVEQFLRDVADGSGSLSSPYAVTAQYSDSAGHATNASLYGGGYDDATGYPANGCTKSGPWYYYGSANSYTTSTNPICLTDAQIRAELQAMVQQNNLQGSKIQPGYTPLLVLLTPPGVQTCIDANGTLCSANSDTQTVPAQFCSYHAQTTINGTLYDYVVQPFTSLTACDDPDSPILPNPITPPQLETDMGARLVSPLSQSQIATIINPGFNGWFALNGDEINDHGCAPEAIYTGTDGNGHPQYTPLDNVNVGSNATQYLLQREFNNGGVIENSPWAYQCTPNVDFGVNFVVPSAVNAGDVVEFDGSKSYSSLLIPDGNFAWSFGDGTTAVGPSAVHSYKQGGGYTVTLTVTDRGGDQNALAQTIQVDSAPGQSVLQLPTQLNSSGTGAGPALAVRLQMLPQSLKAVLRSGIAVQVSSNASVSGIASVSIGRAAARRAHIKGGHGNSVVIGIGTVSSIQNGSVNLHLHLSRKVAAKLRSLGHVTLTVRLALVASGGQHIAVDAAGRY